MVLPVGLTVSLHVRLSATDAGRVDGLVDPSRLFVLFSDAAAELMIRLDGDQGALRGYQQVEVLAPIFVGDFVEVTAVLTKIGNTTRQIAFEARKVIAALRTTNGGSTAADALSEPTVVCRAVATCVVPRAQQRRPRLVLPTLAAGPSSTADRLPEARSIVTPPPHVVITPPRNTPAEVMIAASIVGGGVVREHTPHIPVTPEEVAQEAKRCREAGACLVNLGLTHEQLPSADAFVSAIRATCDVLICLSVTTPAPELSVRLATADASPDLVTIHTGSHNFGDQVMQSPAGLVHSHAAELQQRGISAIAECFEIGHADAALALARDRVLKGPVRLQFVLGVPGCLSAGPDVIAFIASHVQRGTVWFAAGVGRHQRRVSEAAIRMGGNIRVGLGDNIFVRRGELAESSAVFVDQAASFARASGRQPAEPARAKQLLRLVADPTTPSQVPPANESPSEPPAVEPGEELSSS